MWKRLIDTYESDKEIDIIGFSRGAALARAFANEILKNGVPLKSSGKSIWFGFGDALS